MLSNTGFLYQSTPLNRKPSRSLLGILMVLALSAHCWAQSTFGTILGSVKDPSGKLIPQATVVLLDTDSSATRSTTSDQNGTYTFPNLEPGHYRITFSAPGFERTEITGIDLLARQTERIDSRIEIATQAQTVYVGQAASPLTTDVSNLSETKTGRELIDLPVAITTRGSGSTSPISTLTTQPGVQTDPSGNISVAGSKPSMLSVSLDGISSLNVRGGSAPINELFPAFNSIEEIRVSEVNNAAEFGGISDITTISKSGTNDFHGGIFENNQNADLDARNPFSTTKAKLIMNDFGGFLGGPLIIPHLYDGHNRTFFFASYEGLRLPRQVLIVESVPSLALRSGNLGAYSTPVYAPGTGVAYPNNVIPSSQISQVSLNVLNYLYPLPNTGSAGAISNNYSINFPEPISSNQGDIRVDQTLSSKQTVFARFTYKVRNVIAPPTGTTSIGAISEPETDYGFTAAYNYLLSPNLINEVRTGFSGNHTSTTFGLTASESASQIGIPIPSLPSGDAVGSFSISGFTTAGGQGSSIGRNNTFQVLDNLTWTDRQHTFKFGGDYRYLTAYAGNGIAASRMGSYTFNGAITNLGANGLATSPTNHPYIGNAYAAFLLGIPDQTTIASVIQPNLSEYAGHYAFYVQDDWKITPSLTLNYGLRWDYNPMFQDHLLNTANFLPDYVSFQNGALTRGAVVLPNQQAFSILNPGFASSIYPTPILTAAQAGIPESLRYSQKTDFAPRVGFAYRPFGGEKTVIRGGYGKFTEVLLGGLFNVASEVATTNLPIFNQQIVNGKPTLQFPSPFGQAVAGTQDFQAAQGVNFADPYVQQWNLTVERDLGFGIGLEVSYNGSHASKLAADINLNQVPANTLGYATANLSAPYPLWAKLQSVNNFGIANYNAGTIGVKKRLSRGLQFQGSYALAKNLSETGSYLTTYAPENGGVITDKFHEGLDYGNVNYTRRNRALVTFLYELPFGRGQQFFSNTNPIVDGIIGGWELAGVTLFQSGPFLTPLVPAADPSGTGFELLCSCTGGRPDAVAGQSAYPAKRTLAQWLNPAAFAVPQNNIGRFGNSTVGSVVGPGTDAVSMSLLKTIKFSEGVRLQLGGQAANLFNHPNYAPPNVTFNISAYGSITNMQSVEGAGPRAGQVTARLSF